MSSLDLATQQVLTELGRAVGKSFRPSLDDLSIPPDPALGDVAFPCFVLAKRLGQSPNELAKELAAKIGPKECIKSVKAVGPFVNFIFDDSVLAKMVFKEIAQTGDTYGTSEGGKGKRVMVEYAQPNTHKTIHVGHIRNFVVGQVMINVLRAQGYTVVATSYINDLGMHVAACLWGLQQFFEDDPEPSKRMTRLGEAYVRATQAHEQDPGVKTEIAELFVQLEHGKGPHQKQWKTTRKWSMDYIKDVFAQFHLPIDQWYYESDLIKLTRKIIEQFIDKGIVTRSQGAWIVDLEEEGLGVNLLVKSDGTLLYNAKDLGLAYQKQKDHDPTRSFYVIDARQSLAMKQLFATLARAGWEKELLHVSYEFVTLKGGAMSSRKGTVIAYEAFRDELIAQAEVSTHERHPDWSKKQVEHAARRIAFAAMRFTMLRQDLDRTITFEMDQATRFEGATGPYLLYTRARLRSLIEKAHVKADRSSLKMHTEIEHLLLLHLARFPKVVFEVGQSLHLSALTQYTYELCQLFSEYYGALPILTEDAALSASRLAMVEAVLQVLDNALALLAIEPLDHM